MNYGYDKTTKNWKENKKEELAQRLRELCQKFKPSEEYSNYLPYVEVDELYDGVRIRRITHLSDTDKKRIVKEADKIYDGVMKVV